MDRLVTVFGGAGFIGRYVVQELCKTGVRVRAVTRDVHNAAHLRPLSAVGQVQIVRGDLRTPDSVAAACDGADAVVNLVGLLAEGADGSFDAVHARGARLVAEAAARGGARALVHVSAIGADPEAEAGYARSKGEGEAAVRAAFAHATILRPSIVFGPEDAFINRFAGLANLLPVVPVVAGATRFQPVYVLDVARAVVEAVQAPERHGGRIYELGGPKTYAFGELIAWIQSQIYNHKPRVEVPDAVASRLASWFGWLPGAPMTWDQWLMLQRDNVASADLAGLDALGVRPTPLEAIAPTYLVRYRKHGRFNHGERDNKAY